MIDRAPGRLAALAAATDVGGVTSSAPTTFSWPTGFGYMVAAYAAVWLILMGYFWLLSRRAKRLTQRLDALVEEERSEKSGEVGARR
jgi:CcmD family protein